MRVLQTATADSLRALFNKKSSNALNDYIIDAMVTYQNYSEKEGIDSNQWIAPYEGIYLSD